MSEQPPPTPIKKNPRGPDSFGHIRMQKSLRRKFLGLLAQPFDLILRRRGYAGLKLFVKGPLLDRESSDLFAVLTIEFSPADRRSYTLPLPKNFIHYFGPKGNRPESFVEWAKVEWASEIGADLPTEPVKGRPKFFSRINPLTGKKFEAHADHRVTIRVLNETRVVTHSQWKVLKCLHGARPMGRRQRELKAVCPGAQSALEILRRDPLFERIIVMPGRAWGLYRLNYDMLDILVEIPPPPQPPSAALPPSEEKP